MAIKFSVKSLEEVDEALRPQYKAVDANDPTKGFVLDVDGLPQPEDVGALKRSLENAKNERNAAIEKARKAGEDVEAVRKSLDTQMEGLRKQIADAEKKSRDALLDKTITEIATELGGESAAIFVPHLRSRLVIESPDGTDLVRVLGPDGKASALSVQDLKNEFKTSKIFAPVIQAGRASGSGASEGGSSSSGAGGGAGPQVAGFNGVLPANATPAQLTAWLAQQNTPGFVPGT